MKKKIAIIICVFIAGIIAWSLYNSKKTQSPSLVAGEQKTALNENEQSSEAQTIAKDISPIDSQSANQFDQYLNALPTAEDFKTLTYNEVHHTPEIVKDAGATIGRIHSEAQADVSKRSSAMSFFKSCAEDEKVIPAIRAVCLKKIYTLIPAWKLPVILSEEKISKEVKDLSMKIP